MKHFKLLLMTLVMLVMTGAAKAEEVTDYIWNFDKEITTSNHTFLVGPNWKHIEGKYVDDYNWEYWMSYSWKKADGVDGSGALLAYEQKAGDNYDYDYVYDLLVTPVVSGEISIMVKGYGSSGYVELYSLNETGTVRDTRLVRWTNGTDFDDDGYTRLAYTVEDAQRIGIRASKAYLDNFTAATADIEPFRSIAIKTAEPSATSGAIYWNQKADGSVEVKFSNVTVENNGDVALTQGDKGYTVSIINNKDKSVLGRAKVPQDLAKGEVSAPFEVSATIAKDALTTVWSWASASAQLYLQEDLQGSVTQRASSYYRAYEPKFAYRAKGTTSTSSLSDCVDYGMVSAETTQYFEIYNDGTAPLQIVSVTAPEGFVTNFPTGAFEVQPKTSFEATVTLPATPTGAVSGTLTIVYKDASGADKTYTLPYKGVMLGAGTWSTDFNDPEGKSSNIFYPAGSVVEKGLNSAYKYVNGKYDAYVNSYTLSDYVDANNKFITPKLHFAAGETMSFEVAKDTKNQNLKAAVKVYLSTDRVNWGEPVKTISVSEVPSDGTFVGQNFTVAAEGDYYVGYAVYCMLLDNIAGGQKVDVAHDIYFASVTQNEKVQSGAEMSVSAEVIAPIAAAADYTVSYVINGRSVASIDPKVLEGHAKNTKTFSAKVTPTSETTVSVPTYFKFAFSDGTEFTSQPKELTITNEPWFVFLDKGTTVNYDSQAENRKGDVDFGKVNVSGQFREFEILNWGSAPLTVKSVTVPEGFSTSITEPVTVAPKERKPLVLTFSTETPGTYEGTLDITYVDATGADAVCSTNIKGVFLDPDKWYASFDEGWPAASLHGSAVSNIAPSGSNDKAIYSSESSESAKSLFVTPLLHATAGETLTFDARTYSSSWPEGVVDVYAAKTRAGLEDETARISLGKFSGKNVDEDHLLTPEYRNVSVSVDEEGDYYFGFFLINRTFVDNIFGMKAVEVTHEVNMSAEFAATATCNVPASGKLSLRNIAFKAEEAGSYTAAVYVDGTKVAEAEGVELPLCTSLADAAAEQEVLFRWPRTGKFPVYAEISFPDGYKVASEPVEIEFAEEVLSSEVVVGTYKNNQSRPINLNYKNSEAICLYTPADLGLAGGEKIQSITLKGYYSKADISTDVKIAYQLTDETSLTKPSTTGAYVNPDMTEVYNASYAWPKGGSTSERIDMITITFDEPLVYEAGKSLKLFFTSSDSNWHGSTYFESSESGQTYFHQNDGDKGVFTGSWSEYKTTPVLYLALSVEPRSYTATVTDEAGTAVEGAAVALVSNDGDNVQYAGTTDAEGNVTINVIQSSREYDVTVSAAGFATHYSDEAVSVADQSLSQNITLYVKAEVAEAPVFEYNKDANTMTITVGPGYHIHYNVKVNPAEQLAALADDEEMWIQVKNNKHTFDLPSLLTGESVLVTARAVDPDNADNMAQSAVTIDKDGNTTGIGNIAVDSFGKDDVIYNLQGIRVAKPAPGAVYIINGKKVLVK